jgi:pimeloyl-ACP methyl ester carboxylesterase
MMTSDMIAAGQSTGPSKNTTPEDFAQDAYASVQYLRSRDEIDTSKIGLIGHSMGVVEGSILASRYNDIAFLVMLSAPGIPIEENMLLSDSVNNSRSGKSRDEIIAGQYLLRSMIEEVKKGNNSSITEINLNRIIDKWRNSLPANINKPIEEFTKKKPGHWQQMASEWATSYYRYILSFNPYDVLTKVSYPVFSLIGEKDVQTIPEENSIGINNALKNGNCTKYNVEIVNVVNHLFQQCKLGTIDEYAVIEETFYETVMEEIATWIIKQSQQ